MKACKHCGRKHTGECESGLTMFEPAGEAPSPRTIRELLAQEKLDVNLPLVPEAQTTAITPQCCGHCQGGCFPTWCPCCPKHGDHEAGGTPAQGEPYNPRKDPATNWVLDYAIELERIQESRNHVLVDERGNRSPVLTRGTIIDTIWKYLGAAPSQPSGRLCPDCKQPHIVNDEVMHVCQPSEGQPRVVRPTCPKCGCHLIRTGYKEPITPQDLSAGVYVECDKCKYLVYSEVYTLADFAQFFRPAPEPSSPESAHVHNFDANGICVTGGCEPESAREREIAQRCEAATESPWSWMQQYNPRTGGSDTYLIQGPPSPVAPHNAHWATVAIDGKVCGRSHSDAMFIAHARADIPYLLERVRSLRVELAKYTDNRKIADCVDCGGSIWFREARIDDETGTYHPLCRAMKLKEAEIKGLREQRMLEEFAAMEMLLKEARDALRELAKEAQGLREERDAARKDAKDWKREWEMYRSAWIRELGGQIRRKTHEIDALVLTTRDLREERDKLKAELTAVRGELEKALKDASEWERSFEMYRKAWIRELGGWLVPKSHEIDALVLTTRKRCVNPLLGNCQTPHWLGEPTADRKALQQRLHPQENSCREWKFTDETVELERAKEGPVK